MQKNFIFSDTETTGLREKDFIQIIQSASILTDESFERIDAQNLFFCFLYFCMILLFCYFYDFVIFLKKQSVA